MISHTQIPVFVCVKDVGMLRKWFDARKHTTSIIGQMYQKYCAVFVLNVYIFSWYVCQVEYLRSRLFLTFFQCFLCGGTPRSHTEVMPYSVGITNAVNVDPMSKNYEVRILGLNLGLSRDVCEPMVGLVVRDSWWTNQERAVLSYFSKILTSLNYPWDRCDPMWRSGKVLYRTSRGPGVRFSDGSWFFSLSQFSVSLLASASS